MAFPYKVGFIGVGNLAQAMIRTWLQSNLMGPHQIFAANRTPGKLQKVVDAWNVQPKATNEEVIDAADIVIIAVKPQDFETALDPMASSFREKQIVISLAAGITLRTLNKRLPQCRIVRCIPNMPALIQRGVIGYVCSEEKDPGLSSTVEDLFSVLGKVFPLKDEDELEALLVSCSAGVGFVLELMSYFEEWMTEHGFDADVAHSMVVETFLGTSQLVAHSSDQSLEDLQNRVASKKGITAAGLESMREYEMERLLRIAFEKTALRNQELGKQTQ